MHFRHTLISVLGSMLMLGTLATANAAVVALESTRTTGDQGNFFGTLGMDFDVLSPISITALGAFDSDQDGIQSNGIQVAIYDRNTMTAITGLSALITGTLQPLVGNSRFEDIADVALGPGQYTIVSWGHGNPEPNGNAGGDPINAPTINDGGGLISFVGTGRWTATAGAWPTNIDGGPANRYDAGTFMFEAQGNGVPVPGVLLLFGIGFAALASARRSR